MKRAALICSIFAALSVVAAAQSPKEKSVSAAAAGSSASQIVLGPGTRVDGELQGTVDAKSSRVGDQVVLKTTKAIKQNGQTVIPKGSRLIGRITDVQQRSKTNGGSRLGMVFDRIEGKGLSSPINASIVSITNAAGRGSVADTAQADVFGSSSTSASTGRSSGGGLLGGVGSTVGGVTNTAGGLLNTTTQTVGTVANTTTRTVGNTTGAVSRTVNGIQISNSASASAGAATTLSSPNKNIRLEKGATIGLQVNSSVRAQ
jgi:hypothetical protein